MFYLLLALVVMNSTFLVYKGWGDKLPQPFARRMNANWNTGWSNTKNKRQRMALSILCTIGVGICLVVGELPIIALLVFARAVLYWFAAKRAVRTILVAGDKQQVSAA